MIPVGVLLLDTSNSIQEFQYDYTDCSQSCSVGNESVCLIDFELKEAFNSDVYLYYILENYYQANRRFAGSWDKQQIKGVYCPTVDPACYPYDYETVNGTKKPIAPCGIKANAMFNDTFYLNPEDNPSFKERNQVRTNINRTQIAWATDKAYKFVNPKDESVWTDKWAKPPNWKEPANKLDPSHPDNNGFLNEAFLVWSRTGAFKTTRKLYGRVFSLGENGTFVEGLPAGNYSMRIEYSESCSCQRTMYYCFELVSSTEYPVSDFGGRKLFLLSTTSWFGGKSKFLGIAYIVVGCLVLVLDVFLFAVHRVYGQE